MFGVTGIVLVGGFVEDIFIQLREFTIHSQLGHLQVYREGFYEMGRRDPYKFLIENPDELRSSFRNWPEVFDVMKRVGFSGLANNGKVDYPIVGEGVEPARESKVGSMLRIVEGRQFDESDEAGILLGRGVAGALKVKPGDYLTLLVNTPDGALNSLEFKVVGVFQTFSKDFDERAVRIPLVAAQDLLATTGVHSLVFSLKHTEDTDAVVMQLQNDLQEAGYAVKPWYELADFYKKTVDLYRRQFSVLQIIVLVMVVLSVANSVNMALHERTGEFGTLMALGNRRGQIFRLILVEYCLMGLIGAGSGIILGVFLAWLISGVGIPMPPPPNSDIDYTAYIRIVPEVVSVAFLIGVGATVLAAVLPARRAVSISVVEALRSNI